MSFQGSPNALPPVKRKRGRPPKAGSLNDKITSTMNININTLPLHGSPTAELNSNQIVKRGIPDCFTPVMKVSPSARIKKRSRKRSEALLLLPAENSPSKKLKPTRHLSQPDLGMATPLLAAINGANFTPYSQINSRTLDNISLITQLDLSVYNTPLLAIRSHFPGHNPQYTPSYDPSRSFLTPQSVQDYGKITSGYSVVPSPGFGGLLDRNLLPPVSIAAKSPTRRPKKARKSPPQPIQHLSQAPLPQPSLPQNLLLQTSLIQRSLRPPQLQQLQQHQHAEQSRIPQTQQLESLQSQLLQSLVPHTLSQASSPKDAFLMKLMIDELGKAVLSKDFFNDPFAEAPKPSKTVIPEETFKPKLTHSKSAIGIEAQYLQLANFDFPTEPLDQSSSLNDDFGQQPAMLRRFNSDYTGASSLAAMGGSLASISESFNDERPQQPPQTPKVKENYLFLSTGLTPSSNTANNNLIFNLTPQFNSMMYSMMHINSPQLKKFLNNPQTFLNQDFFMNQQAQAPALLTINMTDLMGMGPCSSSSAPRPEKIDPTPSLSSASSNYSIPEDSGDARLALKKIIHVKRQ